MVFCNVTVVTIAVLLSSLRLIPFHSVQDEVLARAQQEVEKAAKESQK